MNGCRGVVFVVALACVAPRASAQAIEFAALPPVAGSTSEELAEWTAVLDEVYIHYGGAVRRTRKRLMAIVEDVDPVEAYAAPTGPRIGESAASAPVLVDFAALSPVPGTPPGGVARWADALRELVGPSPANRRGERARELGEQDVAQLVPAFLEAMRLLDLREPRHLASLEALTADWMRRVMRTPYFAIRAYAEGGDEARARANRFQALVNWHQWWVKSRGAGQDPKLLVEYRAKVEGRRAAENDPPDGR